MLHLAKPEEAIRFYEETGVDCLAIAVGTAHGMYKGEPKIRFDIIEEVTQKHSGSGRTAWRIGRAGRNDPQSDPGRRRQNQRQHGEPSRLHRTRSAKCWNKDEKVYDPRKYLGPAP